jgi:hypothetical protein
LAYELIPKKSIDRLKCTAVMSFPKIDHIAVLLIWTQQDSDSWVTSIQPFAPVFPLRDSLLYNICFSVFELSMRKEVFLCVSRSCFLETDVAKTTPPRICDFRILRTAKPVIENERN